MPYKSKNMQFILEEDNDAGYPSRTEVNAKSADITFAIAVKFDSAGEKLTKSLAQKHGKIYIPIHPGGDIAEKADRIVGKINESFLGQHYVTLNIAGNGIYTMKGIMAQEECDEFTYNLLFAIVNHKDLKVKVKTIRSGGQTGFDESGIKAGLKLKIDTTAYYPKGYRIRDLESDKTQTREEVFKRLGIKQRTRVYVDMDNVLCDFVKLYLEWKKEHPEITFPQSQFGFFSNMEPVENAVESFKKLQEHFDVYILTRPSIYNLMCYTEKADWVKRHLGFNTLENLIICCDKSLLKGLNGYLIDDDTKAGQLDFEGEHIHFKTEKFPDWDSVIKYLIK